MHGWCESRTVIVKGDESAWAFQHMFLVVPLHEFSRQGREHPARRNLSCQQWSARLQRVGSFIVRIMHERQPRNIMQRTSCMHAAVPQSASLLVPVEAVVHQLPILVIVVRHQVVRRDHHVELRHDAPAPPPSHGGSERSSPCRRPNRHPILSIGRHRRNLSWQTQGMRRLRALRDVEQSRR